ncbi:hypothetical protein M877_39575 (plasmid) [Streptomyces niveus NCIMB 11891]|nr:hypothetical protein M877_39575 [Streptomyces niveus NCIMB 11891]
MRSSASAMPTVAQEPEQNVRGGTAEPWTWTRIQPRRWTVRPAHSCPHPSVGHSPGGRTGRPGCEPLPLCTNSPPYHRFCFSLRPVTGLLLR